jgi:hypothetical protein
VEPMAGDLLCTAYKPAEARREKPQAIGDSWRRRPRGRLSWRSDYAAGYKTQKDLRPAALQKAQPREAPLDVVVVQLQQSQPAPLVI